MSSRRVIWGVIFSLFLLCAGSVAWMYARPPLILKTVGVYRGDSLVFFDIDLENKGAVPVVLSRLAVTGSSLPDSVVAIAGPATLGSKRSAIHLEDLGDRVRTGPVSGWHIEPSGASDTHSVRVIWRHQPPTPNSIEITYRYLGMPLRLTVGEEWFK